jgi:hypothetical protein
MVPPIFLSTTQSEIFTRLFEETEVDDLIDSYRTGDFGGGAHEVNEILDFFVRDLCFFRDYSLGVSEHLLGEFR